MTKLSAQIRTVENNGHIWVENRSDAPLPVALPYAVVRFGGTSSGIVCGASRVPGQLFKGVQSKFAMGFTAQSSNGAAVDGIETATQVNDILELEGNIWEITSCSGNIA